MAICSLPGDSHAPGNECRLPSVVLDAAIQPFQGDLRTDAQADCSVFSTGCGVFTSVAARRLTGSFTLNGARLILTDGVQPTLNWPCTRTTQASLTSCMG
jgi:hypothetical protein